MLMLKFLSTQLALIDSSIVKTSSSGRPNTDRQSQKGRFKVLYFLIWRRVGHRKCRIEEVWWFWMMESKGGEGGWSMVYGTSPLTQDAVHFCLVPASPGRWGDMLIIQPQPMPNFPTPPHGYGAFWCPKQWCWSSTILSAPSWEWGEGHVAACHHGYYQVSLRWDWFSLKVSCSCHFRELTNIT